MNQLLLCVVLLQTPPPLVEAPPTQQPAEEATGAPFRADWTAAEIFAARCSACHGSQGRGNSRLGRGLGARDVTSAEWQASRSDDQIRDAIMNGVPDSRMRAFRALGTARQFEELVSFIRGMRTSEARASK